MNVFFQEVTDKIICYKSAINQIDDKLNLIKFLGSVDKSFIPQDLLNFEELKTERRLIEKNLKLLKISHDLI